MDQVIRIRYLPASQWMVNSHADLSGSIPMEPAFPDAFQPSYLLFDYPQPPIFGTTMNDFQSNNPVENLATDTWRSRDVSTSDSASDAVSFSYSAWPNPTGVAWPKREYHCYDNQVQQFPNNEYTIWNENYVSKAGPEAKRKAIRNISAATRSSEAEDHIKAERKRREKLSQRFIALSAVIPGLTKMDKATLLEDATKYVKQLQEQIKKLEKQTKSPTMIESAVVVKKTLLEINDNNMPGFSNETSFNERTLLDESLPEIEARFCDRKVLIRVHCDRKKGVAEKILSEIGKLHMTVLNSSVLAFGSSAIIVAVIAKVKFEFNATESHHNSINTNVPNLVTTLQ
uniref:BHLH domain-containing protein n=1 Tax=Kalanchoe fedtschenkoi TaxID=63787 RepID=A0A7N0ZRM7_KALFE